MKRLWLVAAAIAPLSFAASASYVATAAAADITISNNTSTPVNDVGDGRQHYDYRLGEPCRQRHRLKPPR